MPKPGEVAAYTGEENNKKANTKAGADERTPIFLIAFMMITTYLGPFTLKNTLTLV